jgi:hypothetical protein
LRLQGANGEDGNEKKRRKDPQILVHGETSFWISFLLRLLRRQRLGNAEY